MPLPMPPPPPSRLMMKHPSPTLTLLHRMNHPRPFQILPNNLPADIHKDLRDILPPSRRSLVIRHTSPLLRERKGARARDHAVFLEVRLVADEHDGHVGVVFDVYDLRAEFGEFLEGGHGGYAED